VFIMERVQTGTMEQEHVNRFDRSLRAVRLLLNWYLCCNLLVTSMLVKVWVVDRTRITKACQQVARMHHF